MCLLIFPRFCALVEMLTSVQNVQAAPNITVKRPVKKITSINNTSHYSIMCGLNTKRNERFPRHRHG